MPKCNQCEPCNINGVPCHEPSCPNEHLHPWTMEPLLQDCLWCGNEFTPEDKETCCGPSCAESYYGY